MDEIRIEQTKRRGCDARLAIQPDSAPEHLLAFLPAARAPAGAVVIANIYADDADDDASDAEFTPAELVTPMTTVAFRR